MFQKALIAAAATLALISVNANAVDEDSAKALAKQNKCTKCHSVDKKKDGPSFKETAAKYKGKPDGPDKLYTHLTTRPEIEVDGKKEEHTAVKGSDADIKNLIAWILSQ
ncbi:MAG: c-type cytochrome [Burkholderiaceae bacterium]|jgi:cytochrome c|nr:c-type cytochrome [Burkholderiaceae bacterium]